MRPAKAQAALVPRWSGGQMALSTELAAATRRLIAEAKRGIYTSAELQLVRPLLLLQARWSGLPGANEWLIEQIATREGHALFFYPFEGRLAHLGLATLFSYRLSRDTPAHVEPDRQRLRLRPPVADPGIAFARRSREAPRGARRRSGHSRRAQCRRARAAPVSRDRAHRGPHLSRLPGRAPPGAAAAGVLGSALRGVRRVRSRQSAAGAGGAGSARAAPRRRRRIASALARLRGSLALVTRPARPTPFAFPLLVEMFREELSTESLDARVARMVEALEREAG